MIEADFLTPEEYARLTGKKLSTVRRWCRTGKLPTLPRPVGVRLYSIPRTALVAGERPPALATKNVTVLAEFAKERKKASGA